MECLTARAVVSSRLDGDDVAIEPAISQAVDAHISDCSDCANWAEHATVLRRRTSMVVPEQSPDLSDAILATVMPERLTRRSRRTRTRWILRAVLAVTGALLIAGVIVVVILGPEVFPPAEHLTSTTGFWAGIVGIGFLLVAAFPRLAFIMTPILATAATFLVVVSLDDLINHHLHPIHETPTLVAVLGVIALGALVWPVRHIGTPAVDASADRSELPNSEDSIRRSGG